MKDQQTFFDNNMFHIDKPIRLITLFSGYDSQALALKYLGVPFEHYRTCEWAVKSIQALRDLHFNSDTVDYAKDFTQDEVERLGHNYVLARNLEDVKNYV